MDTKKNVTVISTNILPYYLTSNCYNHKEIKNFVNQINFDINISTVATVATVANCVYFIVYVVTFAVQLFALATPRHDPPLFFSPVTVKSVYGFTIPILYINKTKN